MIFFYHVLPRPRFKPTLIELRRPMALYQLSYRAQGAKVKNAMNGIVDIFVIRLLPFTRSCKFSRTTIKFVLIKMVVNTIKNAQLSHQANFHPRCQKNFKKLTRKIMNQP